MEASDSSVGRRKRAQPKKLNNDEQISSSWHISLPKSGGPSEIENENGNIPNLIDDSVDEVEEDNSVPAKIRKTSSFDGFIFDWGQKKTRTKYNVSRLYQHFLILSNGEKEQENFQKSLIRLGSFKIDLIGEIDEANFSNLENLYLHRTEDDDFFEEYSSNWILFYFPKNSKIETGVLCRVNLELIEFNALKKFSFTKVFFEISKTDESKNFVCVVYFNEELLLKPATAARCQTTQILLKKFLNLDYHQFQKNKPKCRENIDEFYKKLKHCRSLIQSKEEVERNSLEPQHKNLIPILRPYQRQAVKWMVERENLMNFYSSTNQLYVEIKLDGRTFHYSPYDGKLFAQAPPSFGVRFPGGILADEMGLGKTVEILALILLHPKSSKGGDVVAEVPDDDGDNEIKQLVEEMISVVSSNVETEKMFQEKIAACRNRNKFASTTSKRRNRSSSFVSSSSTSDDFVAPVSCFCGGQRELLDEPEQRIQCPICAVVQHRTCVNWMWKSDEDYLCPHCRVAAEPLGSKTTLIISPASICHQWHQEILKHIRSNALNVYVYQGVQAEGFVQPKFLAEFDIVISTYETLRSELHYLDISHSSRLRHPKRFPSAPTPLTAVRWWRVCLDEAQMVEGMTKAAVLCSRLFSINRWCVTGTPIQKSADDLYGLFAFLDIEPYCAKDCWKSTLIVPYKNGYCENIVNAVAPVLWRTVKADVLDQLNIPQQTQKLYWLEFGPVEEHFYRRTREECAKAVNNILRRLPELDVKLRDVDRHRLDQVLRPLLKLRLACCHPQLIRGRFVNLQKTQTSMEDVLERMIQKTKIECEDEHRAIVAALNGSAGLRQLKEEWTKAAEIYRQVLITCDSYDGKIRTDPLPKIHALQNLSQLISAHRQEIPPTCRDDTLRDECDQLIAKYLSKTLTLLTNCKSQLTDVNGNVEEQLKLLKDDGGEFWWMEVCAAFKNSEIQYELLEKIRTVLTDSKSIVGTNLTTKFRDLNGLQMVLANLYEALMKSRLTLKESLQILTARDLNDVVLVNEASLCHLRPAKIGVTLDRCLICVVDRNFDDYEAKLFNFKPYDTERNAISVMATEDDENVRLMGELRRGTWGDHPLEQTLRAVYQFVTRHNVDEFVTDCGKIHLKLFEMMKKEFRAFRSVWMMIRDHVAERDELAIAVERFRFRTAEDEASGTAGGQPSHHIVDRSQIEFVELKLNTDRTVAENELQRKLGQLTYLTGLRNLPVDDERGNPEECPVCRNALGFRWSLLTCGHTFCCDCVRILCKSHAIKCPVCRQTTNRNNISFVATRRETTTNDDDPESSGCCFKIVGDHSTKVESVVKCLAQICQRNASAKCLVFSNWKEVLDIISLALRQNKIEFISMTASNCENCSAECNVLLLPLSSGANGLNIIEATHVLLVDPPLNPAAEQQALGRVHRIGQKKPTVVHRFLIRGTVEEKIHNVLGDTEADHLINDAESPLTVADLTNLFQT